MQKEKLLTICLFLILFVSFSGIAQAGTAVLKIMCTLPAIVGVNVFPDQETAISNGTQGLSQYVITEKIIRENEEIILKTVVVR
jgi:hypothetical protein